MNNVADYNAEISEKGFVVIEDVFSAGEIAFMKNIVGNADSTRETFRKSADIFAIRQFLKEVPDIVPVIFNAKLRHTVSHLFGKDYFVVKSIYFDKPETSNWYVAWHQDLTISVNQKLTLEGYGPWTVKQNQYAVQPPLHILQRNFTIRIHLDDTDENNGALKVIEQSHNKGILRPDNTTKQTCITNCNVCRGGIMIMKPLLMHSSARSTSQQRRRVIHIEFSNCELPLPLKWSERISGFDFV